MFSWLMVFQDQYITFCIGGDRVIDVDNPVDATNAVNKRTLPAELKIVISRNNLLESPKCLLVDGTTQPNANMRNNRITN